MRKKALLVCKSSACLWIFERALFFRLFFCKLSGLSSFFLFISSFLFRDGMNCYVLWFLFFLLLRYFLFKWDRPFMSPCREWTPWQARLWRWRNSPTGAFLSHHILALDNNEYKTDFELAPGKTLLNDKISSNAKFHFQKGSDQILGVFPVLKRRFQIVLVQQCFCYILILIRKMKWLLRCAD